MSIYIRPCAPGASVFFTVALANRGSRLLVDEIGVLRAAVEITRAERPFEIDAWVVMPDHLHCVWTLPDWDADFSRRWGAIKARFVMGVRRACFSPPSELPVVRTGRYAGLKPGLRVAKRESAIWQRRFWDEAREQTIRGIVCRAERAKPNIRDARDYDAHIRYCWFNPVKHGIVERAQDWPYSSVHRDMRLGRYEA